MELSIGKNYPLKMRLFGAKNGINLIFREEISQRYTKITKGN
jgi:hypothetical protein